MSYEELEDLLAEDTFDFVEDTFMDADDLAEHAIPSPPHILDEEDFDPDLWQYDYWMDIDYASDGDEIRARQLASRKTRKRKRLASSAADGRRKVSPNKRRKVLQPTMRTRATGKVLNMDELPPVVRMKRAVDARYEAQDVKTIDAKPLKASALLGNWREKFKGVPMWSKARPTTKLEEVEDASDDDGAGIEGGEAMEASGAFVDAGQDDEEGWEDDDGHDSDDEEGGPMDLDPEALKMALQQNLAAAGINFKGMDQQMLMQMAMKMFSGGGDADALVGEMAESLLGATKDGDGATEDEEEETEDEGVGFKNWALKQAEEKAAAKEKGKKEGLPTPADSEGKASCSPQEKKVVVEKDASAGAEIAKAGMKRKADAESDIVPSKRAVRRFDAPTAASKARSLSGDVAAPVKRRGRK